ncbi:hypothetical protein KSW81_002772 [Nannochloris sp. 'desiccata']|nr:hypothetical protein KSW81_002772 [Chlorella desiccata (nom. nud.)]
MTVDALVNLFIEHNKTTESPPTNTESQREQHFTASSPHPIPNVSVPFHPSPTTALPTALDSEEKPSIRLETDFQDAEVPVVDRWVDLDAFSPPPQSPLAVAEFAECAFCGTVGTPRTCGALVAVQLGDQNVADCNEYINLESEWRYSQNRRCLVCNSYGAAVTCTHAGCRAAYHLPCAAVATKVTLDKSSFELWCPKHAQRYNATFSEEEEYGTGRGASRQHHNHRASGSAAGLEDEEFSPGQSGARPRRNAALSRKHRFQRHVDGATTSSVSAARDRAAVVAATAAAAVAVSDRTQRPRTDWQRQGDAWVKVVPPWWCEHRTIHFANKVFRELFCGHTSAFLVDADGKITVGRYPQGRGLEAVIETAGAGSYSNNTTASKESTYVAAATSKAAIPLPLSNLGPRATEMRSKGGRWLYRKLYGRAPADTDTAPMRDPALATNFLFEVAFVSAANIHYISGRSFGTWMKAAGVQSGDQIRVWRDKTGVKVCRMANDNSRVGEGAVLPEERFLVPTAGVVPLSQMETFTSPPGVQALAALNALAAAAGYAGQHGTPAIDAVLSHAADLRNLITNGEQEANALLSIGDALKTRLAAEGMPLPPSPFLTGASAGAGGSGSEKKRKNEDLGFGSVAKQPRQDNNKDSSLLPIPTTALAARPLLPPPPSAVPGQVQLQQALQQLIRHYQTQMHQQQQQQQHSSTSTASKHPPPAVLFHKATPATVPPPPAPTTATPKQQHQQQSTPPPPSFAAVTTALGLHQWSSVEAALVVQFRATCAVLDSTGRNIAFTNVLQLQNDKEALLDMIRGVVLGNDRGTRFSVPKTAAHSSEGVSIAAAAEPARQPAENNND